MVCFLFPDIEWRRLSPKLKCFGAVLRSRRKPRLVAVLPHCCQVRIPNDVGVDRLVAKVKQDA